MKKVELIAKGEFAIKNCELPVIKNDSDVILRINYVGVCGSDIHYYKTGQIGDQIINYPFIIGHESSATVVETGKGVTKLKAGDTVCIEPLYSCGKCSQCKAGRENTCLNQKFMGCPGQLDGCLTEYLVIHEKMCFPFPANMDFKQAVIVEPFAIGIYASKYIQNPAEKSVLILGFGPIGISIFLALKNYGCNNIYVAEPISERRDYAEKLGAKKVFDPNEDNYLSLVKNILEDRFDVVAECCGEQTALDISTQVIKPGGKLLLAGIPEKNQITLNPHDIRRNEVTIHNVRRQNHCVQEAIDLIASGKVDVDFMITHTFNIEQTKEAFDMVANYKDGVLKALIKINE